MCPKKNESEKKSAALKWWTHKIYDRLNKKFNSINIKFIYFIWSSDSAAHRSLNRTPRPDTFFSLFIFLFQQAVWPCRWIFIVEIYSHQGPIS